MGLLEKALEYKKGLNRQGRQTLMDRITGPAETGFAEEYDSLSTGNEHQSSVTNEEDIVMLDPSDLKEIPQTGYDEAYDHDLTDDEEEKNIQEDEKYTGELEEMVLSEIKGGAVRSIEIVDESTERADDRAKSNGFQPAGAGSVNGINASDVDDEVPNKVESPGADPVLAAEIEREIFRAANTDELCDAILFAAMGQTGASTCSVIVPELSDSDSWHLVMSRGVNIDSNGLVFRSSDGLLERAISFGTMLDINDYSSEKGKLKDYLDFISIDARYIFPIIKDSRPLAALLLGDKVTLNSYSDSEREMIAIICEAAAGVFGKFYFEEKMKQEIQELKKSISASKYADRFQELMLGTENFRQAETIVRDEFEKMGIVSFSVYLKNRAEGNYYSFFSEVEDFVNIKDQKIILNSSSKIINSLSSGGVLYIENPQESEAVESAFGRDSAVKMQFLKAFPFSIGKSLEGFVAVFRLLEGTEMRMVEEKLKSIVRFLINFSASLSERDTDSGKYIDSMASVYRRLGEAIVDCGRLGLPLTIVQITIKNYKRYIQSAGKEKAVSTLELMEKIIKARLSDGDFSVRVDRNRFLIVLPGKDRQFAVPFANSVRNKIVLSAGSGQSQLLVGFMTATYPEDGEDIHSLLNSVE